MSQKSFNITHVKTLCKFASENNIDIQWDEASGNPYLRYKKDGQEHIVWFLDGATFYNQLNIALDHGIKGVSISTLGYEEPSTWSILQNTDQLDKNVNQLKQIGIVLSIHNEGEGELLTSLLQRIQDYED